MSLLLLDEMFSGIIAEQLRAKGHDVLAAVADPALVGLADDQILAHAAAARRTLVTANIKDFIPLDARYRAASQTHAGLILVSAKTFPPRPHFHRSDHQRPIRPPRPAKPDPARAGALSLPQVIRGLCAFRATIKNTERRSPDGDIGAISVALPTLAGSAPPSPG